MPIICVGETLAQREKGVTAEVVSMQAKAGASKALKPARFPALVIAYEPIWAIGTGKTATKEDANDTIGVIRGAVREVFAGAADSLSVSSTVAA